jgi:hypothetical protein
MNACNTAFVPDSSRAAKKPPEKARTMALMLHAQIKHTKAPQYQLLLYTPFVSCDFAKGKLDLKHDWGDCSYHPTH